MKLTNLHENENILSGPKNRWLQDDRAKAAATKIKAKTKQ